MLRFARNDGLDFRRPPQPANPGPEGPGPIITMMAKTVGTFPIPVTIVPGNLTDEEIDALS